MLLLDCGFVLLTSAGGVYIIFLSSHECTEYTQSLNVVVWLDVCTVCVCWCLCGDVLALRISNQADTNQSLSSDTIIVYMWEPEKSSEWRKSHLVKWRQVRGKNAICTKMWHVEKLCWDTENSAQHNCIHIIWDFKTKPIISGCFFSEAMSYKKLHHFTQDTGLEGTVCLLSRRHKIIGLFDEWFNSLH